MGVGWIAFLFIGLIAGWIAEQIMDRNQGLLMNLLVGAIVLLWIVGLFQGRRTG